jgi:hypothetical protein
MAEVSAGNRKLTQYLNEELARAIRREEERMLGFLEKEIPRLTKAVAKAEVPASQRSTSSRPKRRSSRTKAATGAQRQGGRKR